MEKRLKEYIKYMETIARENSSGLSSDKKDEAIRDLLIQIGFFQHERLVHLIVTITFAILDMLSILGTLIIASMGNDIIAMLVLTAFFLVLLIPYIKHYYILENEVQKMYRQYDEILKKL